MQRGFLIISILMFAETGYAQTKTSVTPTGYNLPDSQFLCLKIQTYYNKIKTFKSDFKQVFSKKFHGDQKPEYGKVYIKKPGKMTWEYTRPEKKLFIVDGKKVWVYEPVQKQALWKNLGDSGLPAPVKFLWGKGNLINEFNVKIIKNSKFAGKNESVLKLLPKKKSPHFKSVLFVVDASGAVKQSIVYDREGNRNRIYFNSIILDKPIPDKLFKFIPPKGIQVLEAGVEKKKK
ncbi:MAG: outer membrane lipoprotein chaperone LolA [Deltaproteobacteria bacterium]|nr:outer membrane lipoprotein chaperone LolA [Deltaproteobacteria bacterium]